ncbi:Sulfide_dehydrogenase [Hexamita inflata]|uniref:dihydropyrimidine dehydrogenase (NADP(+)) n=1 Tax=Hexamita inflata TaxID=28002 RepID=A0ABP1HM56_9EUKA
MQIDLEQNCCTSGVSCTSCRRVDMEANVKCQAKSHNNFDAEACWGEQELIQEARRCLYCGLAGCSKGCPTSLNCKQMVHGAAVGDFYYAAKVALSANPLALSTSQLCECEEGACQSGCCLSQTKAGAIKTNQIQKFVMREFFKYGIKAKVSPLQQKINKKVAIIGAGPAGLSAATFLKRLGFQHVSIYEKEEFAGGLLTTQISAHRLPYADVLAEVQLVKDLGVEFHFNHEVKNYEEFSANFDFVLMSVGRQKSIPLPFAYNKDDMRVMTSGEFLNHVNKVVKMKKGEQIDLKGKKVVVLGAGNTAIDCCEVATRLGAEKVTIAFRKQMNEMRAAQRQIQQIMHDGVQFQPLSQPVAIEKNSIKFEMQEKNGNKYESSKQFLSLKADIVIVAFGTQNEEIKLSEKFYKLGDFADSTSVVEAVNDGKTIAAKLFEKVTGQNLTIMPEFYSAVDEVDVSTVVNGVKYPNPFLISSSPTSLTYEHCRKALLAGWGGVVIKTAVLTKDVHIENALRIFKVSASESTYGNNCMVSDHPHDYWVKAVKALKAEFPTRVIIASIMCSDIKEDWEQLAKMMEDAGADALELNFSCPNQCASEGDESSFADKDKLMAMAIGQIPDALARCTKYVTDVVKIPVYPKLTPNHIQGDIDEYAKAAKNGGAVGVSYSNTISSLARIFPNGYPFPQIGSKRLSLPSNGYSGAAIRPIVLAGVCKIRAKFQKEELSILGIGGIESADTALQFIHAGANVVQVCSAVQTYSYEIAEELVGGLKFLLYCNATPRLRDYLEQVGEQKFMPHIQGDWTQSSPEADKPVPKLHERVGLVQSKLVNRDQIEHSFVWSAKAFVKQELCLNCGKCALSCRDNGGHAFAVENGKVKVVPEWCVGCMLCATVCPVGAIEMQTVKPDPHYVYHTDKGFYDHE